MSELAQKLITQEKQAKTARLDLGNCGLSKIPAAVFEMSWLEELQLGHSPLDWKKGEESGNQISDLSGLQKLTQLQSLDLSGNPISDLNGLQDLTKLQSLNLSNNLISDLSGLQDLTQLQSLHLSGNQISNLSALQDLTKLQSLDLSYNQISDLSGLQNLTQLQSLFLLGNEINTLSGLQNLTKLQSLDLSYNQISDLSRLQNLTQLQTLYLSHNQIGDLSGLQNLTQLQSLDLSINQINDLSGLQKLTQLHTLYLSDNQISDLSALQDLTQLQNLSLSYNQIGDLSGLQNLTQLQSLDLRSNQISDITGLLSLFRSSSLKVEDKSFRLEANPITTPPLEVATGGPKGILNWYQQVDEQGGFEHLHEARILIAGEPGAGKTTLFRKLINPDIPVPDKKQKSTHGIQIEYDRVFKHLSQPDKTIQASLWDFGGQIIQNYLHQYFFSRDNLFILVVDHRDENTRFDYWFEIITRFCNPSRVMVVRNMTGRESASVDFDTTKYQKLFKGLTISCIDVDFKTNDSRWDLLLQTIEENLTQLRRINEPVPKLWKPIKEALQAARKRDEKYISYTAYQAICKTAGLKKEVYQDQCLSYLHRLGYALYYDDAGLNNYVFIDPQWITKGLYEVLREDSFEKGQKGRFKKDWVFKLWEKKQYRKEERNLMLSLLLKDKFEVCYKLENRDEYLVPILISNNRSDPAREDHQPVYTVKYNFPFMPFGFFSRLMVRLDRYLWEEHVWLTGAWLHNEGSCEALLQEYTDPTEGIRLIEVQIWGEKEPRIELLGYIRTQIEHIRTSLFTNLIVEERIPCPCSQCSQLESPHFHKRDNLNTLLNKGTLKSQCQKSGADIPITTLLDNIVDQKTIENYMNEKRMGENFHIENHIRVDPKIETHQTQKSKPVISAEISNQVNIDISIGIRDLQENTELLKEDIEGKRAILIRKGLEEDAIDETVSDLGNVKVALAAMEKDNYQPSGKVKTRLKALRDDFIDEESPLRKTLSALRKGKDYGIQIARAYNKIAENTGIPSVPPLVLNALEKL